MKPLRLSKPHMIVMVGIPGSGKSFFAEHFAQTFSAPYINYDHIRSQLVAQPTYSNAETATVGRIGHHMLLELFKTDQTIVYEGPSDARTDRQEIAKLAKKAGYEPLFVWAQTESLAAKSRALKTTKGKSILSVEQFEARVRHFTAPNASENAVVISGKHTYASQLKIVLKRLLPANNDTMPVNTVPRRTEGRHIAIR